MTAITINNPRGDRPIQVPIRPDGELYQLEMIHDHDAVRTYADSHDDLVTALIPDIARADDATDAAAMRLLYAVRAQVQLQAELNTGGDLSACTLHQRAVLSSHRATPPEISTWTAPIPLVLVASYYKPLGEVPRPDNSSNVIWIDPTTDTALIESLHRAGVINLAQAHGTRSAKP